LASIVSSFPPEGPTFLQPAWVSLIALPDCHESVVVNQYQNLTSNLVKETLLYYAYFDGTKYQQGKESG